MLRLIALLLFFVTPALSHSYAANTEDMLQPFEGRWSGAGEVVAGKYKGTKFNCSLSGATEDTFIGMTLEGRCRSGIFSQPMKARIVRGAQGYYGTFNDGATGNGLDITAGKISKNHMILSLYHEKLNGVMTAHLNNAASLDITLAVQVQNTLVPLIDIRLKRITSLVRN
ncbi:MAG: Hypothetical protein BHV28_10750 [Candidatus Tokpelaia hoelldobleri]|uniref:Uncharacterized protein n=1 Tax=Candidatus Tokpelaia hoelldobleri TaxID=1902579 RepID=A0A1U9JV64_9HYPH|nr:MAG: Hypothetical protein BHV28_10750 [Candidatus Tokpelaia hoelldoblerii]